MAAFLALLGVSGYLTVELRQEERGEQSSAACSTQAASASAWSLDDAMWERLHDPNHSVLRDADGNVVATFTDGARTATLKGPVRAFTEPEHTDATVVTDDWVRLMPRPWHTGAERESWFREWFHRACGNTTDDIFAIAFQYIAGSPARQDEGDVQYAGDAAYGPLTEDGEDRREANDFYDYLGIPYTFADGTTAEPEDDRFGSLDCSGYLRMVWGYRAGYPLKSDDTTPGEGLPRTADAMARSDVGTDIIGLQGPAPWYERPDGGFDRLQPGDFVFFKIDDTSGDRLDHSGIYLGLDTEGHHMFISSRKKANGPTIGDAGGVSHLDGDGYYATGFRSATRL